jgi:YaiO family outer membrane protein
MKSLAFALALSLAGAASAARFEDGLLLKKQEKFAEAAAVFGQIVKDNPRDGAALAQWATLLGWLGRYEESISAWSQELQANPGDLEGAVGLARVQYWKGDLGVARATLTEALQRAPNNVDALLLCGDVSTAQRDREGARECYQRAKAIDPSSADYERKLAPLSAPTAFRLDLGGTLDRYGTPRGTEGQFFAQCSWQTTDALVLSAGYEQLHQFGEVDYRLNATGYLRAGESVQLNARFALSPSASTIARWEASGGGEVRLASFVSAVATVRHLDFSNNGVTIVGPGVRLDWGPASLLLQGGPVFSTVNSTQAYGSGRLEVQLLEPLRGYVGYSRGAEAQLLLPPATTTDATAGLLWQVDPRWGLRFDYTYEDREATYTRNSLGSAVTYKF